MEHISTYSKTLNEYQIVEVQAGQEKGLDVSCYAKPEYMAIQMRQIRLGMEAGLDVSVYSKPEFDWFQMEEIRRGMQAGINYELYAKPEIDYRRMRQIRKGLQDGIDLSMFIKLDAGLLEEIRKSMKAKVSILDFVKEGYAVEQLTQIRAALENKVNIRPYISKELRGASIREISLGLEAGLNVSVYAKADYSWQQMREIRLGMEARVDVNQYTNPLYSWKQMRELRLGMEAGLDIESYNKFLYTAADMERMREKLLKDEIKVIVDRNARQQILDERISIFISNNEMEASVKVFGEENITEEDIRNRLIQRGVTQGILEDEIRALVAERKYNQTIVVAKGKVPQTGSDGWYEFFFNSEFSRSPYIQEDGTADYGNVKWMELVEKEQQIALYHSAEYGVAGFTVTGKFLKARKGREKNVLHGQGFRILDDGITYVSIFDGKICSDRETRIDISKVLTIETVSLRTGNINFAGTVYIRGSVKSGVTIIATEDIIVDGYVEASNLKSGGDIFLRGGVNGAGSSTIEAVGNVVGQFFEKVNVVAGGDIIVSQYSMNSILRAEGRIKFISNTGNLWGGVARAAKGIEANNVGNKRGIRTLVNVGVDQEMLERQHKIDMDIETVNNELDILLHSQAEIQKSHSAEERNTMELYLKLEDALYTKKIQLNNLVEKKESMEERMWEMESAAVTVTGTIYEGTTIIISNVKWDAVLTKNVVVQCVDKEIAVKSK